MTLNALRVMAVLYEHMDGENYGLSIGKATKLGNGTLYPIFDKLEDGGLIVATWEEIDPHTVGRRPRRFYRLTADGISQYEAQRAQFLPSNNRGTRHA